MGGHLPDSWSKVESSSSHYRWAIRLSNLLDRRNVIWSVAVRAMVIDELTALAASPYLLSLGLNKSLIAMVFIAGPLSGLIVQPVIGEFGHAFIIVQLASWLSFRYLNRQIEIALWKAATIHVWRRSIQCLGHASSRIYPKVRYHLCGQRVGAGAWMYSNISSLLLKFYSERCHDRLASCIGSLWYRLLC
jgi:hypothetical protein